MRGQPIIPAIVAAAGEQAVAQYRAYLNDPARSAATRKVYRIRAAAFFRWAERRGLSLEAIDATALADYKAEVTAARSSHEATVYLSPVRGVLTHLASVAVLASNPCPTGQPNGRVNATANNELAPAIPLAELKRIVSEISEIDGWREQDEDFRAGLVMLAPLCIHTTDAAAVSRFTGVPVVQVQEFAKRLIENGIWRPDGTIAANWAASEDGAFAFMLDVWVATGCLEREKIEDGESSGGVCDG